MLWLPNSFYYGIFQRNYMKNDYLMVICLLILCKLVPLRFITGFTYNMYAPFLWTHPKHRQDYKGIYRAKNCDFFLYRSLLTFVLGAQKNHHLIETVLLSTHNKYFCWQIRFFLLHTGDDSFASHNVCLVGKDKLLVHRITKSGSIGYPKHMFCLRDRSGYQKHAHIFACMSSWS